MTELWTPPTDEERAAAEAMRVENERLTALNARLYEDNTTLQALCDQKAGEIARLTIALARIQGIGPMKPQPSIDDYLAMTREMRGIATEAIGGSELP